MNLGVFFKGLLAAIIGGAVSGAVQTATSGNLNGKNIGGAAIAGAVLTAGGYLTQSPVAKK